MSWTQPDIGRFGPIPPRLQPRKVWRHLHSPFERWENLVGVPLANIVEQARDVGCPPWEPARYSPRLPAGAAEQLRQQHDAVWADVYGRLLADPETRSARSLADGRWVLLAPQGVFGVVTADAPMRVWTVYRPHPLGLSVPPSEEDFSYFAAQRWLRETGMSVTSLIAELERRESGPLGIWRLARAAGEAEGSVDPQVARIREAALRWLRGLPGDQRAAAMPARSDLLDALEEAIRQGDEAHIPAVLLDLEDAVTVTGVLGGEALRAVLVDELAALLDWCPSDWSRMTPWIEQRAAGSPAAARELWARIGDAVAASALQEVAPVHRPVASLAAALLAPPWWQRWARALARQGQAAVDTLAASEAGWSVGAAHLSSQGGAWEVVPPAALTTGEARVFIVHEGAPEGEDVTSDLAPGQPLWELVSPGEELRVVVVDGWPSGSLADAVTAAERDRSVRISVVEISRPR